MKRLFSDKALDAIRVEISSCNGNEVFFLGKTDSGKKIVSVEVLARGNRDAVAAIMITASFGDVVIHNHPSGDPEPSLCDREVTRDLVFAARVVQIKVLDHIIIGNNRYFSFADQGLIDDYDLMFNGFPK